MSLSQKILHICIIAAFLIVNVTSLIGLQTSAAATLQTNFDCLKEAGYTFANVRAYSLEGVDLDLLVKDTLIYAKRAGMKSQLFLKVCRGKSASFQITTIVLAIASQYYDRFWLSLQQNSNPGCSWPSDVKRNCEYVKAMLEQIEYYKIPAGIQISNNFYKQIFGSGQTCNLSKYPLIYSHNDSSPSFQDYKSFGSWVAPYGKVFQQNVYLCDLTFSKVYEKQFKQEQLLRE